MAGDWIKFELATIDKPEVLLMADLLTLSADDVVGKLLRVWGWFDAQSLDGHAGGVTNVTLMKFIDGLVGHQGFAASMKTVRWLTDSGIPNFDRHNGESAKNRALARDRKAKERSRESHAETVTREEKRRSKEPAADGGPVWSECLTVLKDQGLSEPAARSLLGMLRRDYLDTEIVSATKAAIGKADAKAYILGVLKTRPKKGELELRRVAI